MLSDHILDRCLDGCGCDSINAAPCETEESVSGALDELGGHLVGKLDGLVLDCEATNCDVVCADRA